jgi:hypothetical protein
MFPFTQIKQVPKVTIYKKELKFSNEAVVRINKIGFDWFHDSSKVNV